MPSPITILDGPLGTELIRRLPPRPGVNLGPLWSARYITAAPSGNLHLHREYAAAGATVHTANTFRTTPRAAGERWRELLHRAVILARRGVPAGHLVAGSIAPLEDCYRPDLSPPNPRPEHRQLARALAACNVDLILCETFPHVGEAIVATEEAAAPGLPVWTSFTAGPSTDPSGALLTPDQVARGARQAIAAGAAAVLINCTPATRITPYVERLAEAAAATGTPFGVYANAGDPADGFGCTDDAHASEAARRYADAAQAWVDLGATIIGSCCGTGPAHTAELARRFAPGQAEPSPASGVPNSAG